MKLARIDCAQTLLVTVPNGYEAGQIIEKARSLNPDITIIVRAHYDDEVRYIRERGANHIVVGEHEIAKTMAHFLSKKKTVGCTINNNDDNLLSGTKDLDKYLKPDTSTSR